MNRTLLISILIISIGGLILSEYVTDSWYIAKFDGTKQTCDVNEVINCSTIARSPLAAIPISTSFSLSIGQLSFFWYLTNFIITLIALLRVPTKTNFFVIPFILSLLSIIFTLILIIETLSKGALCLYCMGLWAMNFAFAALMWISVSKTFFASLKAFFSNVFGVIFSASGILTILIFAGAVLLTVLSTYIFEKNYRTDLSAATAEQIIGMQYKNIMALPEQQIDLSDALLIGGNGTLPVDIVMYDAFTCPHCKHLNDTFVHEILRLTNDRIRLYFKNYPLCVECNPNVTHCADDHRPSCWAAKATIAINRFGKFRELHDLLWARKDFPKLSEKNIFDMVGQLGVSLEKFNREYNDPGILDQIKKDANEAATAGVQGTPALLFNKRLVPPTFKIGEKDVPTNLRAPTVAIEYIKLYLKERKIPFN